MVSFGCLPIAMGFVSVAMSMAHCMKLKLFASQTSGLHSVKNSTVTYDFKPSIRRLASFKLVLLRFLGESQLPC